MITSTLSFNLTAQDKKIEPGTYVYQVGSHGSKEMLIFKENNNITFSKQVLTRPSSEVCNGNYIVKGDTLYINFDKDSIPFIPSFKVVKELNSSDVDSDDVIVHLNVLLKTIKHRNEENIKKFAEYDSVTQSSRVNIKVIDSLGDPMLEINSFDSKIILQLSRKCELVVSSSGSLYSSKIPLNRFEVNEVFIELLTYEKYDLPCSLNHQKFFIQDVSANSIDIKLIDEENVITYIKTE